MTERDKEREREREREKQREREGEREGKVISRGGHLALCRLTENADLKYFNPPVVYATDRPWSQCCSYSVWFVVYTTGASCFKVFPCSLSSCFFILFSIVITSLGEEGAGLCASRAFVCLFCTC